MTNFSSMHPVVLIFNDPWEYRGWVVCRATSSLTDVCIICTEMFNNNNIVVM